MFTTCVANFAIGFHRWKTKSAACGEVGLGLVLLGLCLVVCAFLSKLNNWWWLGWVAGLGTVAFLSWFSLSTICAACCMSV